MHLALALLAFRLKKEKEKRKEKERFDLSLRNFADNSNALPHLLKRFHLAFLQSQ
jgi:hypothetical protein